MSVALETISLKATIYANIIVQPIIKLCRMKHACIRHNAPATPSCNQSKTDRDNHRAPSLKRKQYSRSCLSLRVSSEIKTPHLLTSVTQTLSKTIRTNASFSTLLKSHLSSQSKAVAQNQVGATVNSGTRDLVMLIIYLIMEGTISSCWKTRL